jgi:hypothetical protein
VEEVAVGMWAEEGGEPRFKVVRYFESAKMVFLRSLDLGNFASYSAGYHQAGSGLSGRSFEAGWYLGSPTDGRRLRFRWPKTAVRLPDRE